MTATALLFGLALLLVLSTSAVARQAKRRRQVQTGRWRRALAVLGLQAAAFRRWVGTKLRGLGASRQRREELREEFHARTAQQAAELMGGMKGALMKFGQVLSFVGAGLPPQYSEAFAALQADAPPMAPDLVSETIQAELGAAPHRLFAAFSAAPLAAASIGQVHSARTHDGRAVVVKVQYPGVGRAVSADLANVAMLYRLVGSAMPSLDAPALVDEVRVRVMEELDYHNEARNLAAFAALHRDDPLVRVPEPIPELSSPRVLTMTRLRGMRWAEARQAPAGLRAEWGEVLFRFVFSSLYRHNMFNGDPHPGNYLFCEDGSIGFLDFGCTRHFSPAELDGIRSLALAVQAGDTGALVEQLVGQGFATGEGAAAAGHDRLMAYFRLVYEPAVVDGEHLITTDWAERVAAANFSPRGEWSDVTRRLNLPPTYVLVTRINIGVYSLLAELGAVANWRAILEEYWQARRAEPA